MSEQVYSQPWRSRMADLELLERRISLRDALAALGSVSLGGWSARSFGSALRIATSHAGLGPNSSSERPAAAPESEPS